jgi:hypothetical protein
MTPPIGWTPLGIIGFRRRWRFRWSWPWLVPIGVVLWALIGMALVWWPA